MKKNKIYITLDVNLNQIHSVTLKQYNKKSQWLIIKVTENGKPFYFDEDNICSFKMRTPDGCEIYNDAVITDSSVVVEITQNCCASPGHGEAELNIIKRIDEETSSHIATMNLSIMIEKSVYSEEDIIGSSEYKSLTDRIVKADSVIAKVDEIIETTSSAAANASDSAEIAKSNAAEAVNAAASANESAQNASLDALNAADSAEQSKESARNAEMDAQSALVSAEDANNWAVEANNAMWMAKEHLNAAFEYKTEAESYAHGGTHSRENEDVDNAKYYYEQSKSISESFSGALRPMGTVTFSNLPNILDAVEGDMYNISNEFVTSDAFKEGSGYTYPAGTNIYKTVDGYWDCLAGAPVTGIKGNNETIYRKGNINLTPENIGAVSENGLMMQKLTGNTSQYAAKTEFNSPGWYRIAKFSPQDTNNYQGASSNGCEIIIKKAWGSHKGEYHHIELMWTSERTAEFKSVSDISQHQSIKTIRLIGDPDSQTAYIEIYYADTGENPLNTTIIGGSTTSGYSWEASKPTILPSGTIVDLFASMNLPANSFGRATYDGNNRNIVNTYLTKSGDSTNNSITFTSTDNTNPTEWTDISALTSGEKHSSLFNKISTMFKNVRYLYKTLGTTDISQMGNGTVTGALNELNAKINFPFIRISESITDYVDGINEGFGFFIINTNAQTAGVPDTNYTYTTGYYTKIHNGTSRITVFHRTHVTSKTKWKYTTSIWSDWV